MSVSLPATGHSAQVQLQLQIGERTLELAQIGPADIVLMQPIQLPPCNGEVVMHVDGEERRWRVHLPLGASIQSPIVATVRCE